MRKEALEKLKEKARKWDMVMHFAERGNEECDKTCPYYSEKHVDECSIFGSCPFCNVVDALTKEDGNVG